MSFLYSFAPSPHPRRAQAILQRHPEIRNLFGRNPWTALIAVAVVALQIALAVVAGSLGLRFWWLWIPMAYFVGAFANHCLYVIIHDATHRLIFRWSAANRLVAIFADLPNVVPGAIGFWVYHLSHHAHMGVYERDADIPSDWEARLVGRSWYRKLGWEFLFPVFQFVRTARIARLGAANSWMVLNILAVAVFDWAIQHYAGTPGLLYLAASWLFSIGPHPLGARWIQEHYTLEPTQETQSYYGPLNALALNVGYHTEHHDFPVIPWNRLPRVRVVAPEYYDSLSYSNSWIRLWLTFLFDQRYSLHSRVLRPALGQCPAPVAATQQVPSAV